MNTGLLVASNVTQIMHTSRSTKNGYSHTSDAQLLMANAVVTSLVPTPISSLERNAMVQQPKNYVSDRKLLT